MRTCLPGIPKTDDAESAKIPCDRNKGLKMAKNKHTAAGVLSAQGFGTRKECEAMIRKGAVEFGLQSPKARKPSPGESSKIRPKPWLSMDCTCARASSNFPCREHLYLAFNKPAGTECSHTPSHHQSIFSYFPEPFLNRGLEAIGRLDADTTGLLLLTDSGPLNHFLTSPRKHVSKTYRVGVKHPISPEQIQKLSAGVELRGEDGMTRPATVELIDERNCDLTVQEGKYHQVKRMFAAVGNRVESIHRIAIGPIRLEPELASGTMAPADGNRNDRPGIQGAMMPDRTLDPALRLLLEADEETGGKALLMLAGEGALAAAFAPRFAEVHCHNAYHPQHAAAVAAVRAAGLANVRCLLGDIPSAWRQGNAAGTQDPSETMLSAISYPEGTFDCVVFRLGRGTALVNAALSEAFRLLRPDGVLLVAGHNQEGIKSFAKRAEAHFGGMEILVIKSGCRLLRFRKESAAPAEAVEDPRYFHPIVLELPYQIPGGGP